MRGLRLGLGMTGGTVLSFDYYVDSVNGSDSNTGTNAAAAFQTLAKVKTVASANNNRIGLAAGSEWREELDLSSYTGVTVSGYGDFASLGLPKVRGDDVITGTWSTSTDRADSFTNTYSLLWTHSIKNISVNCVPVVFENGSMLQMATSLANCDATAGTFWHVQATDSTPVTIYVHPNGSTNPNSDGKTYEATRRTEVVRVGDNGSIMWVHGHCAGDTLGSIVHGHNALIENCLATGNMIHSVNGDSGTRNRVVAYHPVVHPTLSAIILEHFTSTAAGHIVAANKCIAIGPNAPGALDVTGFGNHTTGSGGKWDSITYTDCAARNGTMDAQEARVVTITRPNMTNGSMLFNDYTTGVGPDSITVTDPKMIVTSLATGGSARKYLFNCTQGTKVAVDGLRLYANVAWLAAFNNNKNIEVNHSVLVSASLAVILKMASTTQQQICSMQYNVIKVDAGQLYNDVRAYASNGGSLVSDYNLFYPLITNAVDSMTYRGPDGAGGQLSKNTLPSIQSAFNLELHSAAANPNIANPSGGDFSFTNNGGIVGVGPTRTVSYTPIPQSEADCAYWIIHDALPA
jgi:hypothetical protein